MIDASISSLLVLLRGATPSGDVFARDRGAVVAQADSSGDADAAKRAQAMLVALQAGTLDRGSLSPELSALMTPAVVADAAKTIPPGKPLRFQQRSKHENDGVTTYVFRASWASGTLDVTFGTSDTSGRVVTFFERPGPPA